MADAEDKEKAEKVAAARKRYEQLKKQKAKKTTTSTTKKPSKDDKVESGDATAPAAAGDADEDATVPDEEDPVGDIPKDAEVDNEPDADPVGNVPAGDDSGSQPSLSLQSQLRSSSFKRATGILPSPVSPSGGLKSPPLPPLSADGDSVQEIYRKQAARIEALEKENKRLEKEVEDHEGGRAKMEDELEELRENRADVVASSTPTSSKGGDLEKLKTEISTLQRQNAQLSQQAKDKRRPSGNIPTITNTTGDLNTQLADKTSTIESQQLEISNLRHSLSESEASTTSLKARVGELEASLKTAEDAAETAQRDVTAMRVRLESTANPDKDSSASSTADANRIALLTSDLHTAQRTATQAQTRASNLEKKIETLSTLHRESESRQHAQFAARSKEMERLRAEASEMRKKVSSVSNENARLRERRARGDSISSAGNRPPTSEGSEAGAAADFALQARVRELEAENADLRRGVWRDRRRDLQDEFDESAIAGGPNGAGFDDVDLSTPTAAYRRKSTPYNALGFTNIINTFTGRDSASSAAAARGYSFGGGGSRRGSMRQASQGSGFMGRPSGELNEFDDGDGDFGFDEDAFRAAQEEQAKQRLERVKEVKRGLNDWRGWKVDLVDLRGGGMAGVFDV